MKDVLTKRQKIVISSIIITLGFLLMQVVNIFYLRYRLIIGLSALSLALSVWSLWEGMSKSKALVILVLPTLFTLGLASFYYLLPLRWLTRIPVAIFFGLGFYSLLLSQNVFSVAAVRTIPLYRAASTVAFLFTIITALYLYSVVYAFNLSFYLNGVLVAIISFPLIMQLLWSIQMEKITPAILIYSGVLSLIIGECALALSFWPITPTIPNMWSISLATAMYVLLGIVTEFFRDRLNSRIAWEYLGVGGIVMVVTLIATSWIG